MKLHVWIPHGKIADTLVFPPAPKKGMVKFSRKGHFQHEATCYEGTFKCAADMGRITLKSNALNKHYLPKISIELPLLDFEKVMH